MTRWCAFFTLIALALPLPASARAKIVMQLDGSGFSDQTKLSPVGGNPGTTLGEQRRNAVRYAMSLWSARLDSDVPIVLHMIFEDLGCKGTSMVLGQTGVNGYFGDLQVHAGDKANPKLVYASALADSLVGYDLNPGEPDMEIQYNSAADGSCKSLHGGFYYGFDGKAADGSDFVEVILHEFGHGLGISASWDRKTGAWSHGSRPDSYSAHVRDLDLDKSWADLTAEERLTSSTNVRRVVWDGPEATRLVPETFALGAPELGFDPPVANFTGFVADSNLGPKLTPSGVQADLYVESGCTLSAAAAGHVVLVSTASCVSRELIDSARRSGLAALLLPSSPVIDLPALPIDASEPRTTLPFALLAVPRSDVQRIADASRGATLHARLSGAPMRYIGADDKHRPFLFVSQPLSGGSSVAHLEELARPSQLMEPFAASTGQNLAFTVAMLKDIGWSANCGNGVKDAREDCDDGSRNSDLTANACRSDCSRPRCGDGVQDEGEACDAGEHNDDTLPNTCRTTCKLAGCGDGVLDRNEACDHGARNSDSEPNACRSSCRMPTCGDGVTDALEQCDQGLKNSNSEPDACRSDCRVARCGDGIVDRAEACDEGKSNADAPNTCRRDCKLPRCGDGIVDDGEECDATPSCSDTCRLPPREEAVPPVLTSAADAGHDAAAGADDAGGPDAGATHKAPTKARDHTGCGCRVAESSRRPAPSGWLVLAGAALIAARRRLRK